MLRKELGHCSILCLEFPHDSGWCISTRIDLDKTATIYLARSAALKPAPATIIVCGAPYFFEADHNFVGLLENLSKNAGRFSRFRGLSQLVVSRMVAASAPS
jgi:hypothetical protein